MYSDKQLVETYNIFSGRNRMSKIDFIGAVKYLQDTEKKILPTKYVMQKTILTAINLFKINEEIILGRCREKHIVKARMFISYFLKSKGYTYTSIGKLLNKDHSSIIHAVKTFQNDFTTDIDFKDDYTFFANTVNA